MKKYIFLLLLFNTVLGFSQADLLNTRSSDDLKEVTVLPDNEENFPLEYAKVNDKDILFSFTVWEVIDLDERVNFPYLYPIDINTVTPDRRPLIHYLMDGIETGGIRSFYDDKFSEEISAEDFSQIKIYKVLKDGIDADDIVEGLEHFEYAGSWRKHLESLGYVFPEEEWVEYDPMSDNYNNLEDNEKVDQFYEKWNEVALQMMPDDDFNSAEFEYSDVRKYVMKGMWYFDKLSTELKYRPIAIGPIAITAADKYDGDNDDDDDSSDNMSANTGDTEDTDGFGAFGGFGGDEDEEDEVEKDEEGTEEVEGEDVITSTDDETIDSESDSFISNERIDGVPESNKEYEPMFWVFYPDARKILSTAFALNEKNMSKPISFDRLINSRRFSATIYKEANVYQDRDIRDYIRNDALMQLLESERVKEKIRNKEQDMWSY